MSNTVSLSDLMNVCYPEVVKLFEYIVLDKIKGFLKLTEENVTFERATPADRFSYGERLIIFLVAGRDIRLTIKVHYNASETRQLITYKRMENKEEGEALESIFSEFGNLISGGIKHELIEMGYVVGISLPIAASAYDEIISSDKLVKDRTYSYVTVKSEDTKFVLTLTMDAEEKKGITDFVFDASHFEKNEDDDGFL